jgi:RimJ/RimL family protein N-acetyltransferase
MIFLETERLLFRTHQLADEADFVQMHTDPEVRRYVGGQGRVWPVEKALDRFRANYLCKPTRIFGLWATILKSDQKYIGSCGLRAGQNKAAHFGYYLARPYWRKGLATVASQAFIEVALGRLRLPRLLADFDKENAVSEHLLQKFGFQYKGEEKIEATGRIIVSYELRQADWKQKAV